MSGSITLKYPVTVKDEKITALSMRRPKVRDMLISDKSTGNEGAKEVVLFANLCEIDEAVIEELDLADYTALQGVYSDFLS